MTIYGQRAGAPNGEFIDGVEFNEPQRRQQDDLGGSIGVQGIGYPHSMRKKAPTIDGAASYRFIPSKRMDVSKNS